MVESEILERSSRDCTLLNFTTQNFKYLVSKSDSHRDFFSENLIEIFKEIARIRNELSFIDDTHLQEDF